MGKKKNREKAKKVKKAMKSDIKEKAKKIAANAVDKVTDTILAASQKADAAKDSSA